MKFLKNNILWIILIIAILLYFNSKPFDDNDLQNKIDVIETEKDVLKSNITLKEIEVEKGKIEIAKKRVEKDELVKDYNFDIINKENVIEGLKSALSVKQKVKIVYKDRIVKKDDSKESLYKFGKTVFLDFSLYRKLDLEERKTDIKKNLTTEKLISDLKLLNSKSESIVNIKDSINKKLKKDKKKIIIGSALAIIAILIIK